MRASKREAMRSGNRSSRLSLLLLLCAAVAIFSASWANGLSEDNKNNDVQDARMLLIDHHHLHGPRDPHANEHSAHAFEHFPSHRGDGEHERRWGRIRDWKGEHNLEEKKPDPEGVISRVWSYVSGFTNPWRAVFHPAGLWEKKPVEQEESRGHRHYWHGPRHGHFHGFHHHGARSFFHRIRDSIWKRPERHVAGSSGMARGGYESSGVLVPTVAKTLDGFFRSTPVTKEPTTTCIGMWEQEVKALVWSLKDALQAQCDSSTEQFSHTKICDLYKVNPKMATLLAFREAEENPVHVAMMRTASQEIGDCGDLSVSKGWHLVKTLHSHLIARLGNQFSPEHDHFMREHEMFRRHEHGEGHIGHGHFERHEHERKDVEHPFDLHAKLKAIENAHHHVHDDSEHGSEEARRPWWRLWHAVHANDGGAREHDNAMGCRDCFVKGVSRLTRGIKFELGVMCASAEDPELEEACHFAMEHRCLTKAYLLSAFPVERMVTHRCRHESQMRNAGRFPHHPHHFGFRMGGRHRFSRPFELGVEERHPHVTEDGPHPLFSEHHVMPPLKHWLRKGGCLRHRANQAYRRAMQLRGDEKDDNGIPVPLIRTHFILFKGHQVRPEDLGDKSFGPRSLGPGHFRDVVLKVQEHMKKMEAAAAASAESNSGPALEEPKSDETLSKPLRQHSLRNGRKIPSLNFRISAKPINRPAAEEVSEPNFLTSLKERARRFRISAKPQPMTADVNGVEENKDDSVKATDNELKKEEVVEGHPQVIFPVV